MNQRHLYYWKEPENPPSRHPYPALQGVVTKKSQQNTRKLIIERKVKALVRAAHPELVIRTGDWLGEGDDEGMSWYEQTFDKHFKVNFKSRKSDEAHAKEIANAIIANRPESYKKYKTQHKIYHSPEEVARRLAKTRNRANISQEGSRNFWGQYKKYKNHRNEMPINDTHRNIRMALENQNSYQEMLNRVIEKPGFRSLRNVEGNPNMGPRLLRVPIKPPSYSTKEGDVNRNKKFESLHGKLLNANRANTLRDTGNHQIVNKINTLITELTKIENKFLENVKESTPPSITTTVVHPNGRPTGRKSPKNGTNRERKRQNNRRGKQQNRQKLGRMGKIAKTRDAWTL